ncbi:MAG: flagella basal body P-ring formation protein FlgA [Rhodobacteraceae bacterium PARR1]|nr:MAG: flagella basal body P-ring formation protein FlgA [Rhodobacteraceae bacterium PARR1]
MRWLALMLVPAPALADAVIMTRSLPARATVGLADVTTVAADIPGAATTPDQVVGQALRVAVQAGRPLRVDDLTAPELVARNQLIRLHYTHGSMTIAAEGRALDAGAIGQSVRVMNLSSRGTVQGVVLPDGSVQVAP